MSNLKRAEWVRCDRCIYWEREPKMTTAGFCGWCHRNPILSESNPDGFCGEGRFISSHLGGSDGTVAQIRPIELTPPSGSEK